MTKLAVVNQILNGVSQPVAISQTSQVVSNAFTIGAEDSLNIAFQVDAVSVTGTGAIVKLQQSFDGTNFTDVDATNAKVTITAAGRFPLAIGAASANFAAKVPLAKTLRFVCTTTGSDAVTLTKIWVQLRA